MISPYKTAKINLCLCWLLRDLSGKLTPKLYFLQEGNYKEISGDIEFFDRLSRIRDKVCGWYFEKTCFCIRNYIIVWKLKFYIKHFIKIKSWNFLYFRVFPGRRTRPGTVISRSTGKSGPASGFKIRFFSGSKISGSDHPAPSLILVLTIKFLN